MEGAAAFIVAPIALVGTYFLLKWKASQGRKYMEKYIRENGLDAQVVHSGIPPLRFWLRNRKGDNWVKVRASDGSEQWARIRGRLFSDDSVDFFA